MENQTNKDKLVEYPTLIGSESPQMENPTLYELNSNFSIMKVENKNLELEEMTEKPTDSNTMNLINLNETVSDPNNYIIPPNENDSHKIDLEFKLDSTLDPNMIIDQGTNQPGFVKTSDNSFEIHENITNICEEKFDLVDMSASNISQASESFSETMDFVFDSNDNKENVLDKTPVMKEVSSPHKDNDSSTEKTNSTTTSIINKSASAMDQTLEQTNLQTIDNIKMLVPDADVISKSNDQSDSIASNIKDNEDFIKNESVSSNNKQSVDIPMAAISKSSQNTEQSDEKQNLKLETIQTMEINKQIPEQPGEKQNLKLETIQTKEINNQIPEQNVESLKKEKIIKELEINETVQNPVIMSSEISPKEDNNQMSTSSNTGQKPLMDLKMQPKEEMKTSSDSSSIQQPQPQQQQQQQQQQHIQVLDENVPVSPPSIIVSSGVEKLKNLVDNDASTFSNNNGKKDVQPPSVAVATITKTMATSTPATSVAENAMDKEQDENGKLGETTASAPVEEAIEKKATSADLKSDFLPTSASKKILSSSDTKVEKDDKKEGENNNKNKNKVEADEEKPCTKVPSSTISTSDHNLDQQITGIVDTKVTAPEKSTTSTTTIPTSISSEQQSYQKSTKTEEDSKKIMPRKHRHNVGADHSATISSEPDYVQEFIQMIFGSCAADILYWRDPKNTGAVFSVGLVILFSLTIFSVISVVAYTLLFTLLVTLSFRVYKNVMQAVNKTEEGHPFKEYLEVEITPKQERAHEIADQLLSHYNCFITRMRSVLLVEDYVESFKYLFLFWALTFIGSWFNGMTLVILAYIGAFTLPKVYEMNKTQIDQYINLVVTKINEITEKVPFLKRTLVEKKEN